MSTSSTTSSSDDEYDDNLTVCINKSPLMSSAAETTDGGDTENELAAMRIKLNHLVTDHNRSSMTSFAHLPLQSQHHNVYNHQMNGNNIPVMTPIISAHSVHSLPPSPTISTKNASFDQNFHSAAVQKLYEQQQRLLNKLQMLEKDDPNPESSKLWNVMQRIFTEENAQQRQQNIEDLTTTLDVTYKNINNKKEDIEMENDVSLLKSIHEISKETVSELKEMRKQLEEERRINSELRKKMRRKNRQLKMLSNDQKYEIENENNEYIPPPIAYDSKGSSLKNDRRYMSVDSVDTDYSLSEDKSSSFSQTFQEWCMNLGFSGKKKRCSWF